MTANIVPTNSNVSGFERRFIALFIEYTTSSSKDFSTLLECPINERPLFFRSSDPKEEIGQSFDNLLQELTNHLGHGLILSTNPNNKIGADMFEHKTQKNIELKLGSATDLNVGLQAVNTLLGGRIIEFLPNSQDRTRWRELYKQQGPESIALITAEHEAKLLNAAEHINSGIAIDQEQISQYWAGNNAHGGLITLDNLLLLELQKDLTWKARDREKMIGDWHLYSAQVESDTKRLNIEIVNYELQALLRLTYNYKNNYKLKIDDNTIVKIPAKMGLGTPSFNGWWKSLNG